MQRKSIKFHDLVPDIASLYSIQDIFEEASRFIPDCERAGEVTLEFDCSEFMNLNQSDIKEPEVFLPWCFLRCIDVAGRLQFEFIQLTYDEETWHYIEPVWTIASVMRRNMTILRRPMGCCNRGIER